jgi:hypothetical protein
MAIAVGAIIRQTLNYFIVTIIKLILVFVFSCISYSVEADVSVTF